MVAMTENAGARERSDLMTPHIRNNFPFLTTLALLILLPCAITYFGPSLLPSFGDFHWMGIAWAVAVILVFVADENFVPGKNNLSSGFRQTDHLSHRLVSNPLFILGLTLLVLGPPPVTYYGPQVFLSSPDWLWLLLGWIVAAVAAMLMYSAIQSEESRLA